MLKLDRDQLIHCSADEQHEILLLHLEMNIDYLKGIRDNINEIRNNACSLGMPWHSRMESDLAHLELDISYLSAEIKRVRETEGG